MGCVIKLTLILVAILIGYCYYDNFDPESLKGKNVLITGASLGIGEQMAYHYARHGARLLLAARSEDRLKKVVERCRELGEKGGVYEYIVVDLSQLDKSEHVIQTAVDKLGGIDYLILNHMATKLGDFTGTKQNFTVLHDTVNLDFFSYVHLAGSALNILEKSAGSIVVVSSVAGKIGSPYEAAYSAAKFALDGFFSALRLELYIRQSNIDITVCIIGFVNTETAVRNIQAMGQDRILSMTPADPSDVAYDIIRGGALRVREVYSPAKEVHFIMFLQKICPVLADKLFAYVSVPTWRLK